MITYRRGTYWHLSKEREVGGRKRRSFSATAIAIFTLTLNSRLRTWSYIQGRQWRLSLSDRLDSCLVRLRVFFCSPMTFFFFRFEFCLPSNKMLWLGRSVPHNETPGVMLPHLPPHIHPNRLTDGTATKRQIDFHLPGSGRTPPIIPTIAFSYGVWSLLRAPCALLLSP